MAGTFLFLLACFLDYDLLMGMYVCLWVDALRSQKRVLGFLRLELQVVVNTQCKC